MHVYEIRPRADRRVVDLISDVLPYGSSSLLLGLLRQQKPR